MIQRPVTTGHLGEWIAARIFDIALHSRASHAGSDGVFRSGSLRGRSVNIKWYLKREGLLDVSVNAHPEFYLVMTGPHSTATTSRGDLRPMSIENVYLFEHAQMVKELGERGTKVGVASSVARAQWDGAEIFPAENPSLALNVEQRAALGLLRAAR